MEFTVAMSERKSGLSKQYRIVAPSEERALEWGRKQAAIHADGLGIQLKRIGIAVAPAEAGD